MAKFTKLIVTPGVHNVGRLDGRTEAEALTPDRLKTWVDNTRKAIDLGVLIPAPFAHQDKDSHFPLPAVRLGTDGAKLVDAYNPANGLTWDAQLNGGFWEDLSIDPATGGISAVVDAPGEITDANSPAGKVGTVVKETSVFVMGPRKIIVGGKEHEIGEHLAHVAMCLHPAQPGQPNFVPLSSPGNQFTPDDMKVAMSFCMADVVQSATPEVPAASAPLSNNLLDPTKPRDMELDNLLAMLRNVCFVDLPETTTRESLVTDLSLALRQKSADQQEQQQEEDKLTQRPMGAETKSPQIAMSQLANGFSPVTTGQALASPAAPSSADQVLTLMMSNLITGKRKTLSDRITALVATGRCTKAYADEKLYPRVTALVMSTEQLTAAGGNVDAVRDPIEDIIEGLEQAQPLAGSSISDNLQAGWEVPPGTTVEPVPAQGLSDLPEADMDEIIDFSCV